jgi:hypothetical protein
MKHRKTLWKSTVLILCLCAGYIVQSGQISFRPRNAADGTIPAGKPLVSYARLPLSFEANQGQTDGGVKYLSRGPGYTLFLTGDEVALALRKPGASPRRLGATSRLQREDSKGETPSSVLRLKLVNANRNAEVTGASKLPGKVNYFIGNDPKKWRTNVPMYATVKYKDIYPGVDLVYYGNQQQLEHDFVVAPGGDASRIALQIEGSENMSLDAEGNLVIAVEGGEVYLQKPKIYQESGAKRREIPGGYLLRGAREVGFQVEDYDHAKPLVIDPVLVYSTYLGGGDYDFGLAIAVDSSGNAYVTGQAGSSDFPTTAGAFQTSSESGSYPAFVAKLNPIGSALVYSTYLGGTGVTEFGNGASGIAVDSLGNAYVSGATGTGNFPTTAGAFQTSPPTSGYNAFVTKLNSSGSALVYSTYLGGGVPWWNFIAVDSSGYAYVTGTTDSGNFPTTAGAFETTDPDCSAPPLGCNGATFITKLNLGGSALVYSTYLGGSDSFAIAVDSSGNAYVTGSAGNNFPTTTGAFQTALASSSGAFVTKLNPSGTALAYSTYLSGGGSNTSTGGSGIAVDSSGNAYVTGSTFSGNFPTTTGAFQTSLAGSVNAFVSKLNPSGSAPVYSTYLGGSSYDSGMGIAVDASGNAYVSGTTSSTNFPTTSGALQTSLPASYSNFVTMLNASGSALVYSTYLSGATEEQADAIALDPLGNVYVTGGTRSSNFPTTAGAFQTVLSGTNNAFVAKFSWTINSPGLAWKQVPGSLSQLSVGSDGTVWGLDSAGQPYMFNPQTQTWQQAPGLLTQITAASSGVVWGLNAAGQIYRYDPSSQSWDQIAGILSQLAVGSDGDVWGMNSRSQIYHFNAATQTWVQIPGALAQLAVGFDGAVWGINASQQVYRFNPGTQNWQQVGGLLKQVATYGVSTARARPITSMR